SAPPPQASALRRCRSPQRAQRDMESRGGIPRYGAAANRDRWHNGILVSNVAQDFRNGANAPQMFGTGLFDVGVILQQQADLAAASNRLLCRRDRRRPADPIG